MKNLLLLFVMFSTCTLSAQVYEYLPVSLTNIETNPSFVASEKGKDLFSVSHVNNFQKGESFSMSNVKLAKYFNNRFSGIGLTMTTTNTYDSIQYNYAGLSLGYRTILFNKIYTKIGVNYKFIDVTAPAGYFTKSRFHYDGQNGINSVYQNMNFSVNFSSGKERYYTVFGYLNFNPSWVNNNRSPFPEYRYMKVGNFWNLFGENNNEISFLIINSKVNNTHTFGYYLTFQKVYPLTRRVSVKLGGEFGVDTNKLWSLRPTLSLSKRKMLIQFSPQFTLENTDNPNPINNLYRLSFNYYIK